MKPSDPLPSEAPRRSDQTHELRTLAEMLGLCYRLSDEDQDEQPIKIAYVTRIARALTSAAETLDRWRAYVQHKPTCAKWGEVWEYPRHLHPEIDCSCGLAELLAAPSLAGEDGATQEKEQEKEEDA